MFAFSSFSFLWTCVKGIHLYFCVTKTVYLIYWMGLSINKKVYTVFQIVYVFYAAIMLSKFKIQDWGRRDRGIVFHGLGVNRTYSHGRTPVTIHSKSLQISWNNLFCLWLNMVTQKYKEYMSIDGIFKYVKIINHLKSFQMVEMVCLPLLLTVNTQKYIGYISYNHISIKYCQVLLVPQTLKHIVHCILVRQVSKCTLLLKQYKLYAYIL